jgi:beta-N-acetylhexosaminidase
MNKPAPAADDSSALPGSQHARPAQATAVEERPEDASPARPKYAKRRRRNKRQRAPLSRGQRVIVTISLLVAIIAALPLGTYLLRHINEQTPVSIQATIAPTPTPNPTTVAEQRQMRYITQMISQMSLDEELGQMLIVEFDASAFNDDLQQEITDMHIGGTILYGSTIESINQAAALNQAAQAQAKIPLFISIDQEGGCVNRLKNITGDRPSARDMGQSGDPNVAQQQGVSDAQMLKQIGVNFNLAPDVDVQQISDGAIDSIPGMVCFGTRMFGNDAQTVAAYAGAYLTGLESQGIIGTLKHFPGLGAPNADPHTALSTTNLDKSHLDSIDFAPYKTLIAQGNVDVIMTTHEIATAYDPIWPATLSPTLIQQVLRQELGYQGVIITDTLHMGAITNPKPGGMGMTMAEAGVQAVIAGNDLLLGPYNPTQTQAMLDALNAAISSGQITKERIDQSLQRILALKIKYGMITIPDSFQ